MHAATSMRFCARAMVAFCIIASIDRANAAACRFEPQGEGRVMEIIDARTFRLQDGREVRLIGIEPLGDAAALTALLAGRDVTLHGESDIPDRYGRQPAFVFLEADAPSVQSRLLAQGAALASPAVTDKDCAAELAAAEAAARRAPRGAWARGPVIKNAESPGDILANVGRFALVEGRVLSVRTAGATTYVNFRAELDTGLCRDYFKAHDGHAGGRGHLAQVFRKTTDSRSRLGRATERAADRGAPGGAD